MKINRLKIILAEKSKMSKWFSKELGKSESTISRWCTNEVQPSIETFISIAHMLNVDVKDLINSTKKKS